jgi:hypothetical protein
LSMYFLGIVFRLINRMSVAAVKNRGIFKCKST